MNDSINIALFPESARILMLKGAELLLVPNACPMEINRLSLLRGRDLCVRFKFGRKRKERNI